MKPQNDFQRIHDAIIHDPSNLIYTNEGQQPIYMANARARILIIGQAPGAVTAAKGIPFDDKSGDTLRQWLGVDRETFYHSAFFAVLPMDFYYNGRTSHGDVPPRADFAAKWHPQLIALMPDIKITLLVGKFAVKAYLHEPTDFKLTDVVQNFRAYLPTNFPLVHPSPRNNIWQAKNPWFQTDVIPTLQQLVGKILAQ